MGIWKNVRTQGGKQKEEVNVKELIARLKAIVKEDNVEIIKLTIESLLDELEDK